MFAVSPPRAVVAIQAAVNTAMGLQWLTLGPTHYSLFPFKTLVAIGGVFIPGHPMVLWGLLFLIVAVLQWLGVGLPRDRIAGIGSLLGAPLLAFYGLLNGLSTASNPAGTFTVLIFGLGLSLWHATTAVMLLGRRAVWR